MATTFLDPSGDATGSLGTANNGTGFYKTVTGAAVATDFVNAGHVNSIKIHPNAADVLTTPTAIVSDIGGRISFWAYFVALPTTNTRFFQVSTSGDVFVVGLRMQATGHIQLTAAGAAVVASGSTLSTGQWYHITFQYKIASTTVNEFRVTVNGIADMTATNTTITTTVTSEVQFVNQSSDTTFDFRISDIYVDSDTSLSYPGNIYVASKRPFSNGTLNQFSTQIGAGGSGYGSGHSPQVNELPISQVNGWSLSNTTKSTEEYSIETPQIGNVNLMGATIIDYMGWITSNVNSTADSPVHHIIVGGVATAITETAVVVTTFTAFAGSAVYPTGLTDIGMDAQFTTNAHLTRLFDCGIVFAYIPATIWTVAFV